jgi:short-subunit dehydrogenase
VSKRLALVTGATSGIGKAFAESLATDGHDLIIVGRREERLREFVDAHPDVHVQTIAADLSTDEGIAAVSEVAAAQPLELLINNAGVAHYMPLAELPVDQARELTHIKNVAPMLLTRAALPGMLAFSGPAPGSVMPRRAIYGGGLANAVAFTQLLAAELEDTPIRVQVVCPGVVATEFHTVQGMDLSSVPRMSAEDVVTACRRGLELGEVVTAPGVEDASLLQKVSDADLAAFNAQSPALATRYRTA